MVLPPEEIQRIHRKQKGVEWEKVLEQRDLDDIAQQPKKNLPSVDQKTTQVTCRIFNNPISRS